MLAKDIMTTDVITVSADERVEAVTKLLIDNKISGIPVVDKDNHITGIVTEKDLLIKAGELKVPFYITLFDSIIYLENPMRFSSNLKKYTAAKVKDIMTVKVEVVDENTPVHEIAEIMQNKKINRLPVVRNNKLIGIVTRNDVLKAIVKNNG
ncbi:MAG TPA: CBS domain-containing protein [Syntrophomonadaceae bacterium]|nr:CBS domain-containing protein [Syntrophomonadaceae bacterium]HNX29814.1 CBS domain-containing protein [Syntrophomonadaceae bacterium]HPR94492.1 CBS domain-containing protein [Syntrophomonadaceae bacterium]